MRQRLEWSTDVLKGRKGHEHRIPRIVGPRESYEAEYTLDTAQLRYLRARLFNDAGAAFLLPLRWQGILGTSDMPVGDVVVTVGTTTLLDWAVEGQRVLVEDDSGAQHVSHLNLITTTMLIIDDPLVAAATFAANRYRVYPLVPVYIGDGSSSGYYPVAAGKVSIQSRAAVITPPIGEGAEALITHDSRIVMNRRPRWRDLANETMQGAVELIDYGGLVSVVADPDVGDIVRAHDFTWRTDAERQWWLQFFAAIKGRLKTFLMPTWQDDLTVASQPVDEILRVWGDEEYSETYRGNYIADWESSDGHDWLQLEMSDGTLLYRTIESALDNGDGTQALTLDSAVDTSGANPDIVRISYMELCRLEEDTVSLDHYAARTEFRLSLRVVQQ